MIISLIYVHAHHISYFYGWVSRQCTEHLKLILARSYLREIPVELSFATHYNAYIWTNVRGNCFRITIWWIQFFIYYWKVRFGDVMKSTLWIQFCGHCKMTLGLWQHIDHNITNVWWHDKPSIQWKHPYWSLCGNNLQVTVEGVIHIYAHPVTVSCLPGVIWGVVWLTRRRQRAWPRDHVWNVKRHSCLHLLL